MSELAKKLRDLAERLESHASGHTSGPISHVKATVYLSIKMDLAPLLAEAERLEEKIRSLELNLAIRESDLKDARETIEAAGENPLDADVWATMKAQRDKAIEKAERLEAQNRRLRELVREAYEEGFSDCPVYGDVDEDLAWLKSSAKAALDKEGAHEPTNQHG